jgi:hypothetical protein
VVDSGSDLFVLAADQSVVVRWEVGVEIRMHAC